jgi:hypothetical protein
MSRPKPTILLNFTGRTYKSEQVLKATAVYAVFYAGQPINLRSIDTLRDSPAKYKKCSFSNSGHAFNLAEKLNKLFQTDQFEVYALTNGVVITEGGSDD